MIILNSLEKHVCMFELNLFGPVAVKEDEKGFGSIRANKKESDRSRLFHDDCFWSIVMAVLVHLSTISIRNLTFFVVCFLIKITKPVYYVITNINKYRCNWNTVRYWNDDLRNWSAYFLFFSIISQWILNCIEFLLGRNAISQLC